MALSSSGRKFLVFVQFITLYWLIAGLSSVTLAQHYKHNVSISVQYGNIQYSLCSSDLSCTLHFPHPILDKTSHTLQKGGDTSIYIYIYIYIYVALVKPLYTILSGPVWTQADRSKSLEDAPHIVYIQIAGFTLRL